MPTLNIHTNVSKAKFTESFLKEATELIAGSLGKPASYVCITVNPDLVMSFGGTTEPCASIDLISIGKLGPELNTKYAQTLGAFLQTKLGIPTNRFYINFVDMERHNVGWNGKTFAY